MFCTVTVVVYMFCVVTVKRVHDLYCDSGSVHVLCCDSGTQGKMFERRRFRGPWLRLEVAVEM
jgi:hypothetical protein